MSQLKEYPCPGCGGPMDFDVGSQKLKCAYCGREMEVPQEPAEAVREPAARWSEQEVQGMMAYECQSCGGQILADTTTGAAVCPYCGNRVVVKEQFAGDLKPEFIIPFQIGKDGVKAAYLRHIQGKRFLPRIFREENHIDEIKGVYVPFWVYDADVEAELFFSAERDQVWYEGDRKYSQTKEYRLHRRGCIGFDRIPAMASSKLDERLMESIEPFDFSQAVPFQTGYLSGYLADRYDLDPEDRKRRAQQRLRRSVEDAFSRNLGRYDRTTQESASIDLRRFRGRYVLYPVWLLNTTWRGEKFTFAMNGQTGKLVGDLPVNKTAYRSWALIMGAAFSGVLYALVWMIMGLA